MFGDEFVAVPVVDGSIFRAILVIGGARDDAPRRLLLVPTTAQAGSVPESRKG
jgi:hypothetical protein